MVGLFAATIDETNRATTPRGMAHRWDASKRRQHRARRAVQDRPLSAFALRFLPPPTRPPRRERRGTRPQQPRTRSRGARARSAGRRRCVRSCARSGDSGSEGPGDPASPCARADDARGLRYRGAACP